MPCSNTRRSEPFCDYLRSMDWQTARPRLIPRWSGCKLDFPTAAFGFTCAHAERHGWAQSGRRRIYRRRELSAFQQRAPISRTAPFELPESRSERRLRCLRISREPSSRWSIFIFNINSLQGKAGCPARIRTSIGGIRNRSLTIRRRGTRGGAK